MQKKIQVLPQQVAELIAAGEVVERPASIVKELVENSVDAGAQKITVEIKNGGISYIRITDDGSGIPKDDLPTAFIRHATSKVATAEDLDAIASFGFRGEALASIAAVSRVEVLSCTRDSISGGRFVIQGSQEGVLEETGCPVGTTIVVRDVFYNTPARMKFLKKDSTEANSIENIIDKIALANPQIAFRFIRDGQVKLSTPGNGDLKAVIYAVYGRDFSQNLIPVNYTHEFITVEGYICRPVDSRSTRAMQNFFINSRYVRSRTCMAALEEAYKSSIMTGKFPACVLNVKIPYGAVDVNVHPAKIEVRFSNERPVFDAVYRGCKEALGAANEVSFLPKEEPATARNTFELRDFDHTGRQQRFSVESYKQMVAAGQQNAAGQAEQSRPSGGAQMLSSPSFGGYESSRPLRRPGGSAPPERTDRPVFVPERGADRPAPDMPEHRFQPARTAAPEEDELPFGQRPAQQESPVSRPVEALEPEAPRGRTAVAVRDSDGEENVKILGELFGTYILIQYNDTFVMVDKHAAHERILYNRLKDEVELGERQLLLSPVPVTLSRQEYDAAVSSPERFEQVGILLEDFGGGSVLVREIPTMMDLDEVSGTVQEIAGKLVEGKQQLLPETVDELLHSMACKAAIKAHDRTVLPEMEQLVRILRGDPTVRFCPHGRPVAITMTRSEIERRFGRLV